MCVRVRTCVCVWVKVALAGLDMAEINQHILCPTPQTHTAISSEILAVSLKQYNLDSILKSKDITLPTKVHLVKAMVFPVVMYKSWTIKKAER